MLVDPQTGMAVGNDVSFLSDMMDSAPSAFATTSWNAMRVSNTIINGGTAGRLARRRGIVASFGENTGTGGLFRGGIAQTANPTHIRRMTRPANIDPSFYGEKTNIYSPFGFLARSGNKAFGIGMSKNTGFSDAMTTRFGADAKNPFAPGTFGRLVSMGDINRMKPSQVLKKSSNIESAIADINPTYYNDVFKPAFLGNIGTPEARKYMLSSGVGETMGSGFLSARMGGYMQGTQAAYAGNEAMSAARAVIQEGSHFGKGFEAGAEAFSRGSKFAEFAGKGGLGMAMKGASVVGNVLLVHDLAEMAGKAIGHGINAMSDAGKSVIGSINKPVMGMGFKDNSVAATSRQRGVMAIQNSKLNMRSFLGSEAAGMAAHFG